MATLNQAHVQLAKSLHPRLLNFFCRFPPQVLPQDATATSNPSSIGTDASTREHKAIVPTLSPHPHNPFLPRKSSISGHWVGPTYSLRRQADIYKLAVQQGVVALLPPTSKSLEARLKKREELGLRVKGTGVGQTVKGHLSERYLQQKLAKRQTAMRRMPGFIRSWRMGGQGRRWRTWPSTSTR